MLHKCEQYTHKDKDTGGTMRERINRLARGIIDSGIPELVLAPDKVEAVAVSYTHLDVYKSQDQRLPVHLKPAGG